MTNPNHEVERFEPGTRPRANQLIVADMFPRRDGQWVRYSDYEKMVKQRDADYRRFAEAKDALTTIERAAIEAQEERDQAKAQALAEVREALKLRISEHEAIVMRARNEYEIGPLRMEHGLKAGVLRAFLSALSTLEDTQGEGA